MLFLDGLKKLFGIAAYKNNQEQINALKARSVEQAKLTMDRIRNNQDIIQTMRDAGVQKVMFEYRHSDSSLKTVTLLKDNEGNSFESSSVNTNEFNFDYLVFELIKNESDNAIEYSIAVSGALWNFNTLRQDQIFGSDTVASERVVGQLIHQFLINRIHHNANPNFANQLAVAVKDRENKIKLNEDIKKRLLNYGVDPMTVGGNYVAKWDDFGV